MVFSNHHTRKSLFKILLWDLIIDIAKKRLKSLFRMTWGREEGKIWTKQGGSAGIGRIVPI